MVVCQYTLDCVGDNAIRMPEGGQLLHVAFRPYALYLWARVADGEGVKEVTRTLRVVETWDKADGFYVGTALDPDDAVLHVFDLGES